ncbi:hypothetical protein [Salmonella sp. s51228]|uniref:hypothetical protein n=1 Tax=Salmonella sp. s51228 TaxID=3159652 RepID=UPI00397F81F5
MGMRVCDISNQMKISHGCVSKIIAKYVITYLIKSVLVNAHPKERYRSTDVPCIFCFLIGELIVYLI